MDALNTLVKQFQDGAVLTNEELNQIVSYINQIVEYINNNIKPAIENGIQGKNGRDGVDGRNGRDGIEGISSLNAFVGAVDATDALSKFNNNRNQTTYPPAGFFIGSNVSLQGNELLFMTSARRRGENDWLYGSDGYIWSVPVQLGSNTTSTTGVDSDTINYVYCRTKRNVDAESFFPSNELLQKRIINYVEQSPNNGIKIIGQVETTINNMPQASVDDINGAWTDHPYGIDEDLPHEWMAGFKKDSNDEWEYYFGPVMISNYGFNGLDGDGFEYIFRGFSTEQTSWPNDDTYPPNWIDNHYDDFQEDDYLGPNNNWEDDAIGVDDTVNKFIYVCTRKKYIDDGKTKATWHAFSPPKLWAQYVPPGTAGPAGQYTQFIFRTTSTDLSNTSLGNTESSLPEYWSEAATSPSSTSEYIWGSHRTITPGLNNTIIYGNWNTPYRISGKNGNNGDGANSMEYIITTSVNEIKYSLNHADVWSLDPDQINIRVYKFTGTAMEEVNPVEQNHDVYVRIQRQDSTYQQLSKISLGDNYVTGNSSRPNLYKYTVSGIQYPAKSIQIIYAEKDGNTYYYKAIKDISVRRIYQRMLIPMGEYDEDEDYEIDESTIPLVYCEGSYYFLDAPSNIGDNNTHIAPTDRDNTVWAEATNYKVLLTDALFANFAKLGSFVIYDKYFFSQFGYVIDSSGNVIYKDSSSNVQNYYQYFDPADPMGYDSPSNWAQKGWTESYKFRPMKVINAESGEEWMAGGNLYIDVEGRANFRGKVMAENLYRKVAITWGGADGIATRVLQQGFETSVWLYVAELGDSDAEDLAEEYNLSVGDYFELTEDIYNAHDYSPGQWQDVINNNYFKVCAYGADYINATRLQSNNGIVYLPKATDFSGKMVEVHNSSTTYKITVKDVSGIPIQHNPILHTTSQYGINFNLETSSYLTEPFLGYEVNSGNGACFYSTGSYWLVFYTAE